jgi:TonB family protein
LNWQLLFLQIIKSSLIILCIATLHATILWLILPQSIPIKNQTPPLKKPITVNLITPTPQPVEKLPSPKAMVAADYSPTSPKMTTTTTQTIKNEKVQSSLQPINQPNNTEIQQKLKPQAQIKPIKKPILKPVKEEITKQLPPLQPHKTTIHQAKITKKSPKKVRHVKTAKPHLQPKKRQQQNRKNSSKIVEPPIKSSDHSTKKNQQIHLQNSNSSKIKIKKIEPTQATTKPIRQKNALQPISPHSTIYRKNKNTKVTQKNRIQRKFANDEKSVKDRITTRNQKTKENKKGSKKSKHFSPVAQQHTNNNEPSQGKFLNGKNGENDKNGGQKKISQLEENHLHKYTEQILASMSQPTTPKTTSSSALFLSGKPPYPMISRRLGETGKVWLKVKVNAQGKAILVKLKRSSGYRRLDQAAIKHIKQGLFQPALENGHPVTAWQEVRLIFQLQ